MKKLDAKIVLQKYIADSGYCSRRQAEGLIREGKVLVNGNRAELGMAVSETDEVRVKGRAIEPAARKIYIALNKPAGYTCTNRKFTGEKNVFELIGQPDERLFVVGRLDKDSRGLVLLTNDGDLGQRLTHPRYEHEKEYLVKINVDLAPSTLPMAGGVPAHGRQRRPETGNGAMTIEKLVKILKSGVDIGDGDGVARMKRIEYEGGEKFRIVLAEGKKRQIRRMFKAQGLEVEDILRTRIGKLELGSLKEGKWRRIEKKDIID